MFINIQDNKVINKVCCYRSRIFDRIEHSNQEPLWLCSSLSDIKKIVIIASSSRSGSSLLFDILKKLPCVYSPSGESVPFFKLNGLASDLYDSDEITPDITLENTHYIKEFGRDLMSDFAFSTFPQDFGNDERFIENYINVLALRFSIEWPLINFDYNVFDKIVRKALDIHFKTCKDFSLLNFYLDLLYTLKKKYCDINPFYYDISKADVARKFPDEKEPFGPPPNQTLVIEEPPYILIGPRRNVNKSDLKDKILLLKDPVSSYRFKWLEKIFSTAEIKIIYLTRNPAASINGLYDGWLHRGFFSGNLRDLLQSKNMDDRQLDIKGYSDKTPWGKWWWNFDRPPHWENYIHSKLEEVCGFQWRTNNEAILKYLHVTNNKTCRLKFEDIIGEVNSRRSKFKEILRFIGCDDNIDHMIDISNLPVVQATQTPRRARWIDRKEKIIQS